MKVGIVGGGYVGLTVAYYLSSAGHQVFLWEKDKLLGGLASGVKESVDDFPDDWNWDLERLYHHWFTNDDDLLKLIDDLDLSSQVIKLRPITATWYQGQSWNLDSVMSLLKFSPLPLIDRLRMGAVIFFLKFVVKDSWAIRYGRVPASQWLPRWMGTRAYQIVWEPLLKGKFGNLANQVSLTWFWSRIYKRTANLLYFSGGMSVLTDFIRQKILQQGGQIFLSEKIDKVIDQDHQIEVLSSSGQSWQVDRCLVTLPQKEFFSLADKSYLQGKGVFREERPEIGSFCLLMQMKKSLLGEVYWLNIHDPDFPFLVIVEHSNLIGSSFYGKTYPVYLGGYLTPDDPRWSFSKEEWIEKVWVFLRKINPSLSENKEELGRSWLFRESLSQPLMSADYADHLPSRQISDNLFWGSLEHVFPWDRGMNYAVQLGKEIAFEMMNSVRSS